jgi:predicted DNA-binding ribbon-helix-helix protein
MFDLKPLPPELKVVQFNKRRYALRLEPIFWQGLEKMAATKHWSLGKLVAEAALGNHGLNLSSYLRMAVAHMWQAQSAQQQLSTPTASSTPTPLWDIVAHCPSPACIIADNRRIVLVNAALQAWLGPNTPIIGALFDDVFVPRLTRSLAETLALMARGKLVKTQFQVMHADRAALASLQALRQNDHMFGLVWLQSTAPMAMRYVPTNNTAVGKNT